MAFISPPMNAFILVASLLNIFFDVSLLILTLIELLIYCCARHARPACTLREYASPRYQHHRAATSFIFYEFQEAREISSPCRKKSLIDFLAGHFGLIKIIKASEMQSFRLLLARHSCTLSL